MGRRRATETALEDLLVAVGKPQPGDRLRLLLRQGLVDETLELGFWIPKSQTYVDIHGRPLPLPDEGGPRVATRVTLGDESSAVLVHERAVLQSADRLHTLVAAARLALNNAGLRAELHAQLQAVRESRGRIVRASDAARRRLELDLRRRVDELLERIADDLSAVEEDLDGVDAVSAHLIARSRSQARAVRGEVRELSRGLYPAILAEGIGPALGSLVARSVVPTEVSLDIEGPVPASVQACIYFVCAEAMTNIAKYSSATAATISLLRSESEVLLEVRDDGVGGATIHDHGGLAGLRDRVEALGGRLSIVSPRGRGTTVSMTIEIGDGPQEYAGERHGR